jgi:hypothetical protein
MQKLRNERSPPGQTPSGAAPGVAFSALDVACDACDASAVSVGVEVGAAFGGGSGCCSPLGRSLSLVLLRMMLTTSRARTLKMKSMRGNWTRHSDIAPESVAWEPGAAGAVRWRWDVIVAIVLAKVCNRVKGHREKEAGRPARRDLGFAALPQGGGQEWGW